MKKYLLQTFPAGILLIALSGSCKKGINDPVTLDKAAGTWSINAIRYSAFYGSGESRDSTVPWRPTLGNNVTFDGISNLEYCFNLPYKSFGNYKLDQSDSISIYFGRDNNRLDGIDSLIKLFGSESGRWKILLLTSTNFNIEKTSYRNNAFPGATKVITYQSFVR